MNTKKAKKTLKTISKNWMIITKDNDAFVIYANDKRCFRNKGVVATGKDYLFYMPFKDVAAILHFVNEPIYNV